MHIQGLDVKYIVTLVLYNAWTSLGLKYAYIWFINVSHMPLDNFDDVK